MTNFISDVLATLRLSPLAAGAIVLALTLFSITRTRKSSNVPGIRYGSLPILGSWQGAIAFVRDPMGCLKDGMEKYPEGCFRVRDLSQEYVVVNSSAKLAEYMAAPDSVLSVQDAINAGIQFKWTMGPGVYHRPYHIPLVRGKLTQNIPKVMPEMQRELDGLLDEKIGRVEKEWREVAIHDVVIDLIAKLSNLALGGVALARNREYIDLAIQYTIALMLSAEVLRPLPECAKDYAVYLTPAYRLKKKAERVIGGYVTERIEATDAGKDTQEDMLQFLIDAAPAVERTMPQLVERLLSLDVASIHTTTMALTNAIYTLCAEEEKYLAELRAEVNQACPSGDFTKESLDALLKTDSFLRECGRLGPIGTVASPRLAMSDFRFKDGAVVPAGSIVCASFPARNGIISEDDAAAQFDGFRYSRVAAEGAVKQPQVVSTGPEYLSFGYGRHACPGRFFAANEMKMIFASLILRYDMKPIPGTAAQTMYIGTLKIPETKLKILMRSVPASNE